MKFHDIPANILTIRIKRTDYGEPLQEQPVFSVDSSSLRVDEFEIRLKSAVVFVRPVEDADIRRLNNELGRGCSLLAQIANRAADDSIELQIIFFTGDILEMGDVEIGVDEYVEMDWKRCALAKRGSTLTRFSAKSAASSKVKTITSF